MKQFNRPSDNMGGLLKIWAVPPSEITIGIDSVSFSNTGNIVEMYCSPGSMSFNEKQKNGNPGISYQTEIKGSIPKDSQESHAIIEDMSRRKWVVIYQDQNELFKVAGTKDNPLRVSFDLGTGMETTDGNRHSVLFYGTQINKAKFIANPF